MTQPTASVRHNGRYVRANGIDVYYEEHGSGEPLILLHGGFLNGQAHWGPHVPRLAERFRLLVPDSRGHGRTANPTGELSYQLLADDAAAFATALGLERPLVLGFSDGGLAALALGMRYPEAPGALAVGAAGHRFSERYMRAIEPLLGIGEDGEADPGWIERDNPELAAFFRETQRFQGHDHWKTLARQLAPMWTTPPGYADEDFGKVRAPALVFVGDRDQMTTVDEAAEQYGLLPEAELYVVPGQDHFTELGEPAVGTLIDFLSRRGARSDG